MVSYVSPNPLITMTVAGGLQGQRDGEDRGYGQKAQWTESTGDMDREDRGYGQRGQVIGTDRQRGQGIWTEEHRRYGQRDKRG